MSTAPVVADVPSWSPAPQAPATIEETGVPAERILQLLVKMLYGAEATGVALADRLCLPFGIFEPLIEHGRGEHLIEVRGAGASGAANYRYALTDLGRERARQFLGLNQYVGPAPVSLDAYAGQIHVQAASRSVIDRDRLRNGFAHLVVDDSLLEQLGPAVNGGKAIFLYGPPGNGKTVLADGIGRSLGGDVYVPHAIDVDGQTIVVFDPTKHTALDVQADGSTGVIRTRTRDRRWVRIQRPAVIVGGELTLDMLDLAFNPLAKYYEAPTQLKANGGVLLVDDFGRQRVRPQDLLNRWIVPLESRVDYLTLHTGKTFPVPFDVLIVFATNLDPASLADEAFLRRVPYKVAVENPSAEQFRRIFEVDCRRRHLAFDPRTVAYLQQRHYVPSGRPLRACHPRDLLEHVVALCRYQGIEPVVTPELLDSACAAYFIDADAALPRHGRVAPSPRPGMEGR